MPPFCSHCGRATFEPHTKNCIAAVYFDLNRDKDES